MSAIDEYLSARARSYSSGALSIMRGMNEWEENEEKKRQERIKKQATLNDELATVRQEIGLDKTDSLVEAAKNTWNGGKVTYNNETGKYESERNLSDYLTLDNALGLSGMEPETSKTPRLSYDIANIATLGTTGNIEKSKIEKSYRTNYDEIEKELAENKDKYVKRIGLDNYYTLLNEVSSKGSKKESTISGYVSDVKQGDLQVKRNSAWDRYYNSGLSSDKQLAESYDEALRTFQFSNPDTGKQTLSATANYIPQAVYYGKKNIPGTIAAVGAYVLTSALTKNRQAAGALAKNIYVATQVAAGFQGTMEQTRGGEFGDMVQLGIPEDIARNAANESAFWQSIIEELETGKDIYSAFKVPQSETVTKGLEQFFKNWGVNIVSEALEEGSQSIVGFVYEKDAARRAGLDLSEYTLQNAFSQALEEAKGGAEVGATMYLAEGLPHIVVGRIADARNQTLAIQNAPANSAAINSVIATDNYGNQVVNEKKFKEELIKAYDRDIQAAKDAETTDPQNAKKYERIVKLLEEGKEKSTSEKGFNALVDTFNKELDAQQTNKKQALTKQAKTDATNVLATEQEKARANGFANMEFNVADKITTGQKNLATFAKNNLGLNVVYYTTKNGTLSYTTKDGREGKKTYKHRGIWLEGNTIYVNSRLRTTKNAMSVIAHEYAHDAVFKNQELRDKVYAAYSNKEAIEYGKQHGWDKPGFMSQEEINNFKEEMFADDVGEYLSQTEVINMIEDGDPSAIKVIKDTLANFVENTSGYRPQFDNVSQFNMAGTSILNGVELSEDLKKEIDKDIKERQSKKLSKKETSNKETKKETSKKETKADTSKKEAAARLTTEQKQNDRWYEEQRADNRSRDAIQKSLAARMKQGVNSASVKAEMARLEKKYNQAKRSAEIETNENSNVDSQGNRLPKKVLERNKNSKVRDARGRLLLMYHGTNVDFDTFDKSKIGKIYKDLMYGNGFYFTPSYDNAKLWAESSRGSKSVIKKEYVNIVEPFVVSSLDGSTTNENIYSKMVEDVKEKFSKAKKEGAIQYKSFLRTLSPANMIDALSVLGIRNQKLTDYMLSYGIDGLIDLYENSYGEPVGQVVVYSRENQIKDVTNQNPTDNPNTHLSAEIDDGKKKNTRVEKLKGKAKENEQKAKANKREARGRGRALKWSWKKNEQQRKEKERWKARTKKREEVISGLKAKAKERQRIRTLNNAKRDLLDKMKRFEKSKTFKYMTDEQKKTYQETFGNIYRGGLSKKASTRRRELIKAEIAKAIMENENVVVSQKVKNMVTSPNKVTLDAIQSIDEMNELLDAFSKVVEQVQNQKQLVGLARAEDALTKQKEFSDAVRELDTKHEEKKYALKAKREARDNNAIGKLINTLQSGTSAASENLSKFFETALSTVETELLRAAGGNRNSKLLDLYKNLNEGVTRERAATVRLRGILNKFLTDKEYKTLRRQLNPRSDWYDTGAEVTDTKGRKHRLILDHGRLISLAMHSMQEQSLKHIGGAIVDILLDEDGDPNVVPAEGGGLVVPDMELAKKGQIGRAVAEGYTIKLTPDEIDAIVGKKVDADGNVTFTNLSKEENDFVKGIQEFFEQTREYTNEVYKTLKGFGLPDIENYFPIVANKAFIFRKVDDNLTARNIAQAYGMFDKQGFVQERNPNAYNPIVLENVADVLTRMMNGVAKYYGYNIALHNNEVLLNTQDGDFSVRDALGRIAPDFIGTGGKGNYDTLTGFISGTLSHPNDIFSKWRGKHAEFTLGLNPGSWVKQLLSIPTTMKYFTAQEMLGFYGGGAKELYDTMKSYLDMTGDYEKGKVLTNFVRNLTSDLDYRSELFGLPDVSDAIDNKSLFETIDILKGIARADRLGVTTVTRLFLYAELSRRNLLGNELTQIPAEEADAIFQEIGYELERFLRQTQPDYSQVYRANITRNSGAASRFITMYSTPVLQMTNNMLQSAYELDYAMKNGTAQEKARAWNTMLKSGMGVFVASLGGVLISRAFSLLLQGGKKDDDDDYDFGKELVVSLLAPTLVLDDIARGFLGMNTYESQTPELIAIDAITEIGSSLYEIFNGKSENAYNKWKKIVTNLGMLFGIPTRDLYKIAKAAFMYADSDLYYNIALRENANAYKKWIETEGSPDTKDFYKAYTATRDKVLESKYGYHKADKEKNIKSNKKESFRKALEDVFKGDQKKVNEYMTILGGYKS